MKTLIASALLLAAGSAAAHNSCNLELDAGMQITGNSIEFYAEDTPIYKIVEDKYLFVNGQAQPLSDLQQALVHKYASGIRAAVPQVQAIALEGIDLAITGTRLALDNFLGEKNQISMQLTTELKNVKSDVNRYFNSGMPLNFNRADNAMPQFLGEQFETRIERIVETSVQNSIGSIMMAMGKEIIASGGDMEAFEARINKFGEQMEQQMSLRASAIEVRGQRLCSTLRSVDDLEEQLRQAVPGVEPFDVIRTDAGQGQLAQQEL
ncbi:MAG TPA: DUF2884 family protein [Cellvibrio sp.]|nr:DUF2884 family protein [Cellvibrio sp.]